MTKPFDHIIPILLLCFSIVSSLNAQLLGPDDKIMSVFFGGGSYYVDEDQAHDLVEFVTSTEKLHQYQIEVHGHTDNIGSAEFNKYLSFMRCEEVVYIIEELEIERDKIFQYDHGESNPDYSNKSWKGKLHNRRVDIILRKLHM